MLLQCFKIFFVEVAYVNCIKRIYMMNVNCRMTYMVICKPAVLHPVYKIKLTWEALDEPA